MESVGPSLGHALRTARTKTRVEGLNPRGLSDRLFGWLGNRKSNKRGSKNDATIGCRKTKLRRLAKCALDSLRSDCSVRGGFFIGVVGYCCVLLNDCGFLLGSSGFGVVVGNLWNRLNRTLLVESAIPRFDKTACPWEIAPFS